MARLIRLKHRAASSLGLADQRRPPSPRRWPARANGVVLTCVLRGLTAPATERAATWAQGTCALGGLVLAGTATSLRSCAGVAAGVAPPRGALVLVAVTLGAVASLACSPPLVDEPWRIEGPRVIAVTVEPPEAAPGARVALEAVVAMPEGTPASAAVRWFPCEAARPFSQNGAIEAGCAAGLGEQPLGPPRTEFFLSPSVCARFGPDAPADGVRPRDPEATGGYFQPVGVQLGKREAFAFVRLSCPPAGISFEVAQAYAREARPNTNPSFTLRATIDGAPIDLADALPAGAEIALQADWSQSPEESFAQIDLASGELTTARERYEVAWFSTTGVLAPARSSAGAGHWQLPVEPAEGTLWAVLRDSRGGVAVQSMRVRWR